MSTAAAVPVRAGWPRRIGALLVDWFVSLLTVSLLTGNPIWEGESGAEWWPLIGFLVEVGLVTGLLGYSIGQRLFDVAIIGVDGQQVRFGPALLRTALICLVIPPLVNNDDQRGLHDLAARTMAVRR